MFAITVEAICHRPLSQNCISFLFIFFQHNLKPIICLETFNSLEKYKDKGLKNSLVSCA